MFLEMKFSHYHSSVIFSIRVIFKKDIELLKKIALSDLTHIMNIADHLVINMETIRINSGCSLEKSSLNLSV